jgi:hypothetical protein
MIMLLVLVSSHLSSWACRHDFVFFFSLGCIVYFFCVGVYVISVPGYNVDIVLH